MKTRVFFFCIAMLFIASCQQQNKVVPVDLSAEKTTLNGRMDQFNADMKSGNVSGLVSALTDNGIWCGTDKAEVLDKPGITKLLEQSMTDTTFKMTFNVDRRELIVSPDGKSAIGMDQMVISNISPSVPVRSVIHFIKVDDKWMYDFFSIAFIPDNKDIALINKAMEK
ncbi:MAG: hypothetical protein U0X39_03260 [Bacteroidales bacterium]